MTSTTLQKTISMANQIAREFATQRPKEAAQATYDHIWHFWDPRMRAMIIDHATSGGAELSDIAREAVAMLHLSTSEPRSVTQATQFNKAGDSDEDRSLMSDAG